MKWPVAVVGLLSLPALAWSLYDLLRGMGSARPIVPFLVGCAVFVAAWYGGLNRPGRAGFFATMEHELTHALFAWATLHRVVGFRGTWTSGGHIRYLGKGNWLIAIAPFVCPTFSLLVAAALGAVPRQYVAVGSAILGVTLAYHATTTWSRAHRHQGDLREVGTLFSLTFVPAATLLVYGLLVAFVIGGGRAMHHYVHAALAHTLGFGRLVWAWITG
ncbi:MAG TPA: hypothetical protein VKE22_15590 [Haliangiales bacterium]|nr:hypothetical protein [Haliangiales bacterium]